MRSSIPRGIEWNPLLTLRVVVPSIESARPFGISIMKVNPFRGGFWDWVRNPWGRFSDEVRSERLRQKLTPVGKPTEDQLKHLVNLLSDDDDKYVARDVLKEIGEPAVPHLINALSGPKLWTKTLGGDDRGVGDFFASYKIAIRLLEPYSPPTLLDVVLPRISDSDEDVRESVVQCVAHLGLDASIAPIKNALRGEDTMKPALRGIRSCVSDGSGGTEDFRRAMLEELLRLLESRRSPVKHLAEPLLLLDQDRAITLLTSDDYLTLENNELHKLLEILSKFKADLPMDQIFGFVESLRQDHETYPRQLQYGACLGALVDKEHERAREFVDQAMQSPKENVRQYAREALQRFEGLQGVWNSVCAEVAEKGLANVSRAVQVYFCVSVLDAEVHNGGFHQYFANSSGGTSVFIVGCLEDIGADESASILRRALRVFRPEGPSADRETRAYQLAKLSDVDFETLDGLGREYFRASDKPLELLSSFAIAHKNDLV